MRLRFGVSIKQEGILEELRIRTGVLLAAPSLAAAMKRAAGRTRDQADLEDLDATGQ